MGGRTISLAGFHESGKSTVGRLVAKRLKLPFKDTDSVIEDLEKSPPDIVLETEGEDYIRGIERRVVLSTPEEGQRVLAVSAMAFNDETIPFLKRLGPTIHLDLTFQEVLRRSLMRPAKKRRVSQDDFGTFIKMKRFYSRASFSIWTEGLEIDDILDAVLRLV